MNTKAEEIETALVKRADLPPIVFTVTEESLAKLRKENSELVKITSEDYDVFKASVRQLTSLRTGIEAERNEQLKLSRQHTENVNGEAKRITSLIAEIEKVPKKLKSDYDDEQKRIKNAEAEKKQARTDKINAAIDLIEQRGKELDEYDAAELSSQLNTFRANQPSETEFEEFHAVALERWESTIARITVAHGKRVAYELEQQKLKEAQDKLDKDTADAAARQKIINDENAEAAKQLALDRELFQKEQADAKAKIDNANAETARLAQEEADRNAQKKAEGEREERDKEIAEQAAIEALEEQARINAEAEAAEAEALLIAPDKEKLEHYALQLEELIAASPVIEHQKAEKVLTRALRSLEQTKEALNDAAERL